MKRLIGQARKMAWSLDSCILALACDDISIESGRQNFGSSSVKLYGQSRKTGPRCSPPPPPRIMDVSSSLICIVQML